MTESMDRANPIWDRGAVAGGDRQFSPERGSREQLYYTKLPAERDR